MWCWLGPTKRRLRPDAVPTIFENHTSPNKGTLLINQHNSENYEFSEDHIDSQENPSPYPRSFAENIHMPLDQSDSTDISSRPSAPTEDVEEKIKQKIEELQRREEIVKRREEEFKHKEELQRKKYEILDKVFSKQLKSAKYFQTKYYATNQQLRRILKKDHTTKRKCDDEGDHEEPPKKCSLLGESSSNSGESSEKKKKIDKDESDGSSSIETMVSSSIDSTVGLEIEQKEEEYDKSEEEDEYDYNTFEDTDEETKNGAEADPRSKENWRHEIIITVPESANEYIDDLLGNRTDIVDDDVTCRDNVLDYVIRTETFYKSRFIRDFIKSECQSANIPVSISYQIIG